MQQRAVDAIRDHDAALAASTADGALWVAVSHGDVIKAIVADALGQHLDTFQRIVVDTAVDHDHQLHEDPPVPGPAERLRQRARVADPQADGEEGPERRGRRSPQYRPPTPSSADGR